MAIHMEGRFTLLRRVDRDTSTTMKPIMSASVTPDSGNTTPSTSFWLFSALLMYFELGGAWTYMYMSLCVWCNIFFAKQRTLLIAKASKNLLQYSSTKRKPGNGAMQWRRYLIQLPTYISLLLV